jgi:integrase
MRKEIHPPDADEVNKILGAAKETEYYEALHTAFHTGLRRGELLGLRWRDLDLNMGTVSINCSVYRARGGETVVQEPKTAKGRRLVSLTPSSILVLRALRDRHEADGCSLGYAVNGDSLAFRHRDGTPILPRGFSGAFALIMRRA